MFANLNSLVPSFSASAGSLTDERFWGEIGWGRTTAAQVDVDDDTALTYSAVWACTRLLAGTGSWLPLRLWQESDSPSGTRRTHLKRHPVQRLLKRPNSEMNGLQWRSIMWQWQINRGNAYSEIVWHRNEPRELWPLPPWQVKPMRDPETDALYYEYKPKTGDPRRLEPYQVLHIPSILTLDGITGMGVVAYARESIAHGIAIERHGANHFGRGAVPKIIIEKAGQKFDDNQRKAFRKEWNEIYGGPTGEKVGVLGGDATAKVLTFSQEDSQYLESRMFEVEEISRWYGVPPHLVQHLLRATFNNIEELGIAFVIYSLILWMRTWEEALEFKLLPDDDERDDMQIEHDAMALMRGDRKSQAEFIKAMVSIGLMSRNEGRRMLQLDPVDGGDTFLVQGANVPLDDQGRPESSFANPELMAPDAPEPQEPNGNALKLAKAGMVQALNRMLAKESDRVVKAAKNPGKFLDWLDEFYESHEQYVSSSMENVSGICASLGMACDPDAIASSWCRDGHAELLGVSECRPSELSDRVISHVQSKSWTQRPAAVVLNMEA